MYENVCVFVSAYLVPFSAFGALLELKYEFINSRRLIMNFRLQYSLHPKICKWWSTKNRAYLAILFSRVRKKQLTSRQWCLFLNSSHFWLCSDQIRPNHWDLKTHLPEVISVIKQGEKETKNLISNTKNRFEK